MSAPACCWHTLQAEIERSRQNPAFNVTALENSLVQRLQRLGKRRCCSPNAIGWLQKISGQRDRTQITFNKKYADGCDNRGHPAASLARLSHLRDGAVLAFSVELDPRRTTLLSYSVSIQGTRADTGRSYHARIDLTGQQAGQGRCGHPLLHCHIGDDPEVTARWRLTSFVPATGFVGALAWQGPPLALRFWDGGE